MATNALVGAGTQAALDVFERALASSGQGHLHARENLLLLARLVFVPEIPETPLPRLPLGRPDLAEPASPDDFPMFPLATVGDLPVLLVAGYHLAGQPDSPASYLEWCRAGASVRPAPLQPTPEPVRRADEFLASPAWRALQAEPRHDRIVRLQIWRAVSDIVPLAEEDEKAVLAGSEPQAWWPRLRTTIGPGPLRWDDATGTYQRP